MKNYSTHHATYLFGFVLVACASAWFFLWNLGANSISLRSDEVIYTRVAQGVLHNGDFFPLMHGNAPTFEKPPLKIWLSAVAPLILGENNFSFRVLDGCLGVLTVCLTIVFSFALSKKASLALLSGALLLGMPELVISHHGFRRAVLDGLLTFLTLISAWLTWKAIVRERAGANSNVIYRWIGAVCSAAIVTKSVAGFIPALCAMAASILCLPSSRRVWRDKEWWGIITVPAWVFALYSYLLAIEGGTKALNIFLGVEVMTRIFSGFEGHNTGHGGFYLWYLFIRGASAPRFLLIAGVVGALLAVRNDTRFRFLLVWGFLPVLLYSCAASRVPWYLNPYLPFLAIIAVFGTQYLIEQVARLLSVRNVKLPPYAIQLSLSLAIVLVSAPAYGRAAIRHARVVSSDTQRLQIDLLVSELTRQHSHFAIIENALSGRSKPRNGRFNVEGIYREMLKPNLRVVQSLGEFNVIPGEVVLVKESSLSQLPPGWHEIGRAAPFGGRTWAIVALVYPDGGKAT